MKKINYLLIALFYLLCVINTPINAESDELIIKVKVGSGNEFNLKSETGFEVCVNGSEIMPIKAKDIVITNDDGLMVKTDSGFFGPYQNATIKSTNNATHYNNSIFNGSFYIANEKNALVNAVNLENYIYSVVASEMGSSFEPEALKAQAVAARSYAYSNMNKFIHEGFNLSSDIYSQIYNGSKNVNSKIKAAVDATKGLYAKYKGQVINATYSSSNGGVIASSDDVWGNPFPYLVAKYDPFSMNTPNVNWSYEISKDNLDNLIASITNKKNFNSIELIKNNLGRVETVNVVYADGKSEISANKFRTLLGSTNLKSTLFDIKGSTNKNLNLVSINGGGKDGKAVDIIVLDDEPTNVNPGPLKFEDVKKNNATIVTSISGANSKFTFYGKGFGHGVGLSQFGANEMAKKGMDFLSIIDFYFPGTEVEGLDD